MDNFKKRSIKTISKIKEEKLPVKFPIKNDNNKVIAFLRPVTKKILNNKKEITLLAKWRKENSFAFPSQFKVTFSGTRFWLNSQLINNPTRILFFIEVNRKIPILIGHMGLYSFDFKNKSCEIDNVVRGEKKLLKGIMGLALKKMIDWTQKTIKPKFIYLRVISNNERAVKFYEKNGFKKQDLIPLKKIVKLGTLIWHEDRRLKNAEKHFLKMKYKS